MTPSSPSHDKNLRHPAIADGARMWRIARDSQVLDVNSPYAYLLWCRDFAAASVVTESAGSVVGFVTGYLRPDDPGTYLLWQVAVDAAARGQGIAGTMIDWVVAALQREDDEVRYLETTITDDNLASRRLFDAFAERHGAPLVRSELFPATVFPSEADGSHAAEFLYRIGPILAPDHD